PSAVGNPARQGHAGRLLANLRAALCPPRRPGAAAGQQRQRDGLPPRPRRGHPDHGAARDGPPDRAGAVYVGGTKTPGAIAAADATGSTRRAGASEMAAATADIGLIGLAVMGENLVLNMESHGFTVAGFNRTLARVDDCLAGRAKGKRIVGCRSVKELVAALKRPRKVMIMVKAGPAVDQVIEEVAPLLEPGDIVIDGGNTHYPDTTRRTKAL